MPKSTILIVSLTVILISAFLIYLRNVTPTSYKPGIWREADNAINQAQHLYQTKKEAGLDFSQGPCLSNDISPGWVVDIAHSPRQALDDDSQNQCPAFIEGRAKHFVELDLDGNLIRVK